MVRMQRVLLLEDHDDVRKGLTFYLTQAGFRVFDFDSAEAASAGLDDTCPDIAILDVRLPGRSGDDFGRELVQRCPKARVLFATAEADIIDRLKAAVPGSLAIRK